MKLTHFDRTIIHGLGLMTRPPIVPQPENDRMIIEIMAKAAARASDLPQLAPLFTEVRRLADACPRHRGITHHVIRAMDEFDRNCMAVHWDAARRG